MNFAEEYVQINFTYNSDLIIEVEKYRRKHRKPPCAMATLGQRSNSQKC